MLNPSWDATSLMTQRLHLKKIKIKSLELPFSFFLKKLFCNSQFETSFFWLNLASWFFLLQNGQKKFVFLVF
jgi:hypothetical protein